jgi:2-(1,2-epoxy-1,2-dihydrophenyl)acetyl-CoA isomerase|tara:strand:+ start:1893 stop:2708 length:816 start_codon:yes stop_codon:yes gene_type:complete
MLGSARQTDGKRMYNCITLDEEHGCYWLTFDRPEKMNSFTQQMHKEVKQALERVVNDSQARVLVIAANGRGFCAGQDLSDPSVAPGADLGELIGDFYNPMILQITELPIPTLAKVQGVAAGAGANIALACDLVFAGESASFIQAFSGIGLIPDSGGTWQLPRLVGMAKAMGLAMLATKVKAKEAAEMGMIWQCTADVELDAAVNAAATRLTNSPTLGLARTKQALRCSSNNTLAEQLTLEKQFQQELGNSNDYAEGVAAFSQKRQPKFVGR